MDMNLQMKIPTHRLMVGNVVGFVDEKGNESIVNRIGIGYGQSIDVGRSSISGNGKKKTERKLKPTPDAGGSNIKNNTRPSICNGR